jgi:hypothetical protein
MHLYDKHTVGSFVLDGAIHARDSRVDALDRHAEERDRLFIWALYEEAFRELERKSGPRLSAGD